MKTNEHEILSRINAVEKKQSYQARTEVVKWMVSTFFFLGLVVMVDNQKTDLINVVMDNKESTVGNKRRVDSTIEAVRQSNKRIDSISIKKD